MRTPVEPLADGEVICHALLLALVASKVRTLWHAGVIDADTAMRRLDTFLSEICSSQSSSRPVLFADSTAPRPANAPDPPSATHLGPTHGTGTR